MANKKRKQEKPVKKEVASSRTDALYIKTSVERITFDYMDKMDKALFEKRALAERGKGARNEV